MNLSNFFALSLLAFIFWIAFWIILIVLLITLIWIIKRKTKEIRETIKRRF